MNGGARRVRTKPEAPQGLPPQRRVLRTAEFPRIERQGKRASSGLLIVWLRVRRDGRPGRVGLTISKKVGNAVVRNRVRRRLKEIVRRNKQWLDAKDIVVIVKPEAASAPQSTLHLELQSLVDKLAPRSPRDEPAKKP